MSLSLTLTDRISLLELWDREYPNGICVEIGVAGAHFSKQILKTWKSLYKLVLVDSWQHFPDVTTDACNLSQAEQDERYEQVKREMIGPKVAIIRMMSTLACKAFGPTSIHAIYLDANHSTDAVRADLNAWWPKLKPGGTMAGHDYAPGDKSGYGVKSAVDAFALEHGLEVQQTTQEYGRPTGLYGAGWEGPSFVLIKP